MTVWFLLQQLKTHSLKHTYFTSRLNLVKLEREMCILDYLTFNKMGINSIISWIHHTLQV